MSSIFKAINAHGWLLISVFSIIIFISSSARADSYGYDVFGRVVNVTVNGTTTTYSYDAAGNRTNKTTTGAGGVNHPPVANGDSLEVDVTGSGGSATVYPLTNDTDPDGDAISITSFTQGANGSVTAASGSGLLYSTTKHVSTTDTFTYTISDGRGGTSTATVSVRIVKQS